MKLKTTLTAFALSMAAAGAFAQVVGVSWSNFQEERWKTDEAAIKAAVEKAGGTYVSADAQSSPAKQLTDIESLIARGAKALIVLAQDADAVRPAVEKAIADTVAAACATMTGWSLTRGHVTAVPTWS